MKRVFIFIIFLMTLLKAGEINLKTGWNIISDDNIIDVNKTFSNSNILVVWTWNGRNWSAFSSNEKVLSLLKEYNISLFSQLNPKRGAYVLTLSDLMINPVYVLNDISFYDGNGDDNSSLQIGSSSESVSSQSESSSLSSDSSQTIVDETATQDAVSSESSVSVSSSSTSTVDNNTTYYDTNTTDTESSSSSSDFGSFFF